MFPHCLFPNCVFPNAVFPGATAVIPPLVMAGWSSAPLSDDTDPFGVDPDQTAGIN